MEFPLFRSGDEANEGATFRSSIVISGERSSMQRHPMSLGWSLTMATKSETSRSEAKMISTMSLSFLRYFRSFTHFVTSCIFWFRWSFSRKALCERSHFKIDPVTSLFTDGDSWLSFSISFATICEKKEEEAKSVSWGSGP